MKQYFHVTPQENVKSILQNGLEPRIGPRSEECGETTAAIFVFASLDALEDACGSWLFDGYEEDEPLALLAISMPELPVTPGAEFEAFCTRTIAPAHIRLLAEDFGEFQMEELRRLAA